MNFYAERAIQEEDPIYQSLLKRLTELEDRVTQQARTITGLQNELIRASRYSHDNLETRVDGIQVLLARAGEYQGRQIRRKK